VPPKVALGLFALAYSAEELLDSESDRARIVRRFRKVLDDQPDLATYERKTFLRSLEASLEPRHAKPGSVEALIDELVNVTHDANRKRGDAGDEHYQRVATLGFSAVPALMEHLDDNRMTRTIKGFDHLLVRDLVERILKGLAGDKAESWQRARAWNPHSPLKKEDVQAWWNDVRAVPEENYLAEHVLSPKTGDLNLHNLDLVTAKYPQRLEGFYKSILDARPQANSYFVCQAVLASSLPQEREIKILTGASKSKKEYHRDVALEGLAKLNQKQGP
jgi:hypothetical protein